MSWKAKALRDLCGREPLGTSHSGGKPSMLGAARFAEALFAGTASAAFDQPSHM